MVQRETKGGWNHATIGNLCFARGGNSAEALGDTFLTASAGMRPWRAVIVAISCFAGSLLLGAVLLQRMPMGLMYAVWSSGGIILTSVLGYLIYKQALDMPAIIGLVLIGAGLVTISIFSHSVTL
ncbi:MAG: QacE family quaternary ammonium compound efflux SMR transporter [Planctomycetes bacterium]|nr:QacE family quaternary ammonium compound efflux SMR transporter [Planctomycetota bacterium]